MKNNNDNDKNKKTFLVKSVCMVKTFFVWFAKFSYNFIVNSNKKSGVKVVKTKSKNNKKNG